MERASCRLENSFSFSILSQWALVAAVFYAFGCLALPDAIHISNFTVISLSIPIVVTRMVRPWIVHASGLYIFSFQMDHRFGSLSQERIGLAKLRLCCGYGRWRVKPNLIHFGLKSEINLDLRQMHKLPIAEVLITDSLIMSP